MYPLAMLSSGFFPLTNYIHSGFLKLYNYNLKSSFTVYVTYTVKVSV
jgi:hypothetical protein